MKEIKTQLSDQKNKEIKGIDKKQFVGALKFYNSKKDDLVAKFLLETLNCLIHG